MAAFLLHLSTHDKDVASRQRTTAGTITTHDTANHSRYGYTFLLNGRSYSGWQTPTGSDEWTIGQKVMVYYDPIDPSTNALKDFGSASLEAVALVPVLVLAILGVVVAIFFMRRRSVATV